ncbi:GntR family transcriptional regulator [Nocardiopsis ansamitocini]|uniref:GntR family transcriptional regulator n=1 Tax=Nocardiopsis ansamitocini TaxID=1670832 RepID=A0A9W6P228_9ACTN|nr:GntR family transcriptional regulator [Nocardiopsis ansamitocini]GLU45672.1 GntR family transcriptional regulator [Nocardiopsis ansamitocini]
MPGQANKADQAYERLEDMITFQELAPGQLLSESMLMELTGFGRTPVREALQRLARERMVEILPRRGVFVATTSIEEHFRLLELRRTLEELAVRLATFRAQTRQKESMLELAGRLDAFTGDGVRDFGELLKRAHTLMAVAGHNDYLQLAMAPLQALSRRFWFAHLPDVAEHLHIAAGFHSAILRAVAHGDEADAVASSHRLNDYLVDLTYQALGAP